LIGCYNLNMSIEKWEIVWETFDPMDAEFVLGRLRAESIPARIRRESAGRAIGLTIGKLGTSFIEVPLIHSEQAQEIIATDYSDDVWDDADWAETNTAEWHDETTD